MKKISLVIQPDSMDCAPACLKMIASYYGREYSLETLRDYTYTGRDGVSMLAIGKAAERIGFRTVGGRITFDKLVEKQPFPCILHWDQEHFVVLYKIRKFENLKIRKLLGIAPKNNYTLHSNNYKLYVADPGKGLIQYTKEEFLNHWLSTKTHGEEKGVALLLEPTTAFYEQKDEERPQTKSKLRFLAGYFMRYKAFFLQLIIGLLAGSLLLLIFPFLTQAVVDKGIGNKDVGFIWLVLLAQLMLLFGRTSLDFIRRRILLYISARINISLISDFFIKLMKLPMKFFDTKLLGDLLQRIDDHNRVERFLTAQTLNMLFSLFSMIVFGIVLFVYNLKIFLVFLAGSLIYALWITLFLKRRKLLDYKYFEQQAKNRSATYQLINGMQEIKLQGCEQRKRWEWEDVQADLFDVNMQSLSLQQTQEAGSIAINEIKNILITVLSATAVIHGNLTLGMMLSVQYIIGQLNSPVEQMMNFIFQWQDVGISLDRMNEIHGREEETESSDAPMYQCIDDNAITIKDLMFQYEGPFSKKVLNHINLEIPAGKVTAIVGASGSGKTTLIKLLLRFYEPTEGEILFPGNVKTGQNLSLQEWRMRCGAVMQDGFIFSESIARNIAVSEEEIDVNRLKHAAETANIDDFIQNLPLGYNTVVGQEGQGVSQGQRQRILIARAVYKNPEFIFLDEATNALDANNEKVILENLQQFYAGKTVVVVAHRLSTVKNADQIVVLENGEIAETGTHKALTEKRGKYYELVKNQLELGN